MAKLRRTLAEVEEASIETVGGAYVLQVDAGRVDVHRFDALAGAARAPSTRVGPATPSAT